jgi:hypothetical protein
MPMFKLRNFGTEILPREKDVKMALVRYRVIPIGTSPRKVARIASSLLRGYGRYYDNFIRLTQVGASNEDV